MRQLTLQISGMSCGHCVHAVQQALSAVPGVSVESVQIGRAQVSYDERTTSADRLAAAVVDAGYPAQPV